MLVSVCVIVYVSVPVITSPVGGMLLSFTTLSTAELDTSAATELDIAFDEDLRLEGADEVSMAVGGGASCGVN